MQALSAPGQQGAQAKPGSGTFSWLDAFQARQEALKAQAAGKAALLRQLPVCTPWNLCIPGDVGAARALIVLCCALDTLYSGVLRWLLCAFSACAERLPLPGRHS